MGKPLSRPDCLRQNPTCLGKGEEEDGYIEDCYVPQRSIYDTMRINEQIDQGSKLNQTSKSTMEKMEGSTISSNGTLGTSSNVFESRAPEGKKLDERIIFDALKLSSDVQKSAPAPPRRRPNVERKDNVNRRSWKSFMPPNFPEFAERMEASLSEVSEAGASNPSLQEKKESNSALTESSGHLDSREPQPESVTLEHVSKSIGIPEVQDVKNVSRDCQDFRFQQHRESSPHEFQPLESEATAASGNTDVIQEHRFSSATWPRAMKSLASKGSFSEKQHPLGDTTCTVELPSLSPCLSEELLDPELHILITPSLREKTESELKFEEDERWIMMEAEEEWEEEKLSNRGKTSLIEDIFEEREQANIVAGMEGRADCSAAASGTFDDLAVGQSCYSDDPQPSQEHLASVVKDTPLDDGSVVTGESSVGELKGRTAQGLAGLDSDLECTVGLIDSEQLSDSDSIQMFLELEKECLCEEGVTPFSELEKQASSEGLAPSQDTGSPVTISHFPGTALEKEHAELSNMEVEDNNTRLDCDYLNALDSSQVPNAVEIIAHSNTMRDTFTVSEEESEKVPFSPKTAGEFKFRHPAEQESREKLDQGGLSSPDHRAFHAENVLDFEAELAKENGNLSQVDCSQIEGSVEEPVERFPLSSFYYEQTDVTSGIEVEVSSSDSHILTDEIFLESERGITNQDNSLTSLGNVESFKLSGERVCDEDGEAQELVSEAMFLEDRALPQFHRDSPEQVFQDFQGKTSDSEIPNVHQLAEGLRHSHDGVETVNDTKPELNVTSLEARETEMRDLDLLLNEEHIAKTNNAEPIWEEWIPILQKLVPGEEVPDAAETTPEGLAASATAVTAPEELSVVVAPVPFPEEDVPVVAVATIEAHVPAASVVIEEDAPAAAVPFPDGAPLVAAVPFLEGTASSTAVPTDVLGGSVTPAATVPAVEEPDTPAARVPSSEEPALPAATETASEQSSTLTARMSTSAEHAAPAAPVPDPGVPATPVATVPTPKEPVAIPAAVSTPQEPVAPPATVPAPEEPIIPSAMVPTLGDPVDFDATLSILEECASPNAAVSSPEESVVPPATVPASEEPITPSVVVPTPEEPVALDDTVSTLKECISNAAVSSPEEPAAPAAAVSAMEETLPAHKPFLVDTVCTDSVAISEGAPVLEEAFTTEMLLKEDLDCPAFGIKEVTRTLLHGKVPLAATGGLNSNEVIAAFFFLFCYGRIWRLK